MYSDWQRVSDHDCYRLRSGMRHVLDLGLSHHGETISLLSLVKNHVMIYSRPPLTVVLGTEERLPQVLVLRMVDVLIPCRER